MSTEESSADEMDILRAQGAQGLAIIFSRYRERLSRMVSFRLDPRVRVRLDAADVLQEAYLRISQRLASFVSEPQVSCYVWMRQQTLMALIDMQRGQFRERRDLQREVHVEAPAGGDGTSVAIANFLAAEWTTPSQVVVREEEAKQIREALESMRDMDREVLALRHFELLGNQETAEILGISPTAASNRYIRAVTRLGEILRELDIGGSAPGVGS